MHVSFRPIGRSIKGACAATSHGRSAIYKLIAAGKLDARKSGGKTIVTEDSLQSFIASLPPAKIGKKTA
jgi:hypothetical protein